MSDDQQRAADEWTVRPADSREPATVTERSALMIDGLWDDSDYPEHSHTDVLHAYRLGYEDGSR